MPQAHPRESRGQSPAELPPPPALQPAPQPARRRRFSGDAALSSSTWPCSPPPLRTCTRQLLGPGPLPPGPGPLPPAAAATASASAASAAAGAAAAAAAAAGGARPSTTTSVAATAAQGHRLRSTEQHLLQRVPHVRRRGGVAALVEPVSLRGKRTLCYPMMS